MEEALPSPYDIAPIPDFPFEAQLWWFVAIFIAALLGATVLYLLRKRPRVASVRSPAATRMAQKDHCKTLLKKENISRIDLDFLSDMGRQLLNVHFKENLLASSRNQLKSLAETITHDTRRDAVRLLSQLEDIRYQRSGPPDQEREVLERIFILIDRLEEERGA